jgi:hypothetical protein
MTLSAMSRAHVDDPPARAAQIARASTAAGLASLPTLDCLRRRSVRARETVLFSSVLQTPAGGLGYSMEDIMSRLAA